ncbi:hypothetical protein COY95_03345, partial [Candidatus Woesearchaeota archaeon CG_4_10_14_0_8_um_filter_47_5]
MKFFRLRKAQVPLPSDPATGAAALIAIIALVLVFYILALPSEVRDPLLNISHGNGTGTTGGTGGNQPARNALILLRESPGDIDFTERLDYEHDISPFHLYLTVNSQELARINPFTIEKGSFDEVKKNTTFSIPDLANTKNTLLSFETPTHEGILTVKFNGFLIYQNQVTSATPEPIALDPAILEDDNTLEFSVSGVGSAFWKKNIYSFKNVRIIGDVADTSRQESKNVFFITAAEKNNLEAADIKFYPDCVPSKAGRLDVLLNNRLIFSGVPDCGLLNKREFAPAAVLEGENRLVFRTQQGSYLV